MLLSKLFLLQHFWNMFFKTKTSRWRFIKKILFSQSSTDNLRFISFYDLFNSVITNIFKSRRFIFIHDLILLYSSSRLFKRRRIKEHSKIKSRRSEWLCVHFIKRYIDSRSFDKNIDHWICVFLNDERNYWSIIDNQVLSINSMIDFLF